MLYRLFGGGGGSRHERSAHIIRVEVGGHQFRHLPGIPVVISSKPHGGEEHGEEDLDEGAHDEADDTASAEEPLQEEMDVSTE